MTLDLATVPVPGLDALVGTTTTVGTPAWWFDRLLNRLELRKGQAPGIIRPSERGQSPIDDPGTPGMLLFDAYYHGNHRQTYKIRKVIDAFGLRMPLFVNYCGVVVDALAERIGVSGFNFHEDDKASAAANEMWQANNLDAGFNRGIREGLTKGEFSLSVWPDEDSSEPRICIEDPLETIVAVNPADQQDRRAALKRWPDADLGVVFATLYMPDAIYKFQADAPGATTLPIVDTVTVAGSAWRRRIVDGEPWPLPNPYGEVPIFPIPNRPDTKGVGVSELELVLPIQDLINANIANVMLAGLYGAFRQKWATNFQPVVDPTTKAPVMPWNISEDSIFTAPPPPPGSSASTQFGEFDQTDLSGYLKTHDSLILALATTTRLPGHYLLGSAGVMPSGEALTAAERGLAEKARERGIDMKDPIEDAQRFAFKIASQNEKLSSAARARFAKWASMTDAAAILRDPESHTESQHIDALGKMKALLGLPNRYVWAKVPLSPDEIRQVEEQLVVEKAAAPPPPAPTLVMTPGMVPAPGPGATPADQTAAGNAPPSGYPSSVNGGTMPPGPPAP
jgi:hypothetical protein